ncbi:MAG: SBBP repeat-containing protein [Candidatus Sulfotelmatobacter sp.]
MPFIAASFRHETVYRHDALQHRIRFNGFLSAVVVCALLLTSAAVLFAARAVPARNAVVESYGHLPLSFEANRGQTDAQVKFISRGPGYTLFLTGNEAVFSLQQKESAAQASDYRNAGKRNLSTRTSSVFGVRVLNANRSVTVGGLDELPGRVNYFRGNDPSKWSSGISTFSEVRYQNILRGIDLVYYGNQGQLEYDFVVSPGADSRAIQLKFNGVRGLRVDALTGDLVVSVGKEELRFHHPVAYQNTVLGDATEGGKGESRQMVAAGYSIDSLDRVSFRVGNYDHTKSLVIDPTLSYSAYLGGANNDYATSIAVDSTGNAYVTGYTSSVNFPTTTGSFQTTCSGGCTGTETDAFVSKIDPTGSFLVYSTYLGGSGIEYGNGIALDASGDAYIVGQTFSTNFPTTKGAFQPKCGSGNCSGGEAFITELNSAGSALIYSTYLGGTGATQGNGIALDASNNAYLTGYTQSAKFPVTPGAFQTTCKCSQPVAFATELNASGTALVYSTYLGGTGGDVGYAVALDTSDNAYVTGYTHSVNFPVTSGAFQTKLSANSAAFVSKVNPTGSALVYSTYLGGSTTVTTPCETCATDLAVDSSGNAYICGLTAESNFPVTPGAYQTVFMSNSNGHDAFLTKLNASGTAEVFSTYLGGSGDDGATGIAVDASGNTWLRGNTKSTNFPVTPGAFQMVNAGDFDAWVGEIDPTGSLLLYSTYLGGSGTEYGGATRSLAISDQLPPSVYVTGWTDSTNFPVSAGSLQSQNAGLNDGFVTKFAPSPNVGLPASLLFGNQNDGTTSPPEVLTLTNTGNEPLTITNISIAGTNGKDFAETSACTTGSVAPQSTCTINVTFTPSITGNETATLSVTDDAPNSPQSVSLTGFGIGTGPAVQLSASSLAFPITLVGTQSKAQTVTLTNVGTTTLTISQIAASIGFTETNTCGSSVAVGANCTITITFKPTVPNGATGAVSITDNAAGSPQSISLSGTGTVVTLAPTLINFGSVTVGQSSSPHVATFKNSSKSALAVSITVTGTDPAEFPETNTCGTSVPASSTCSISVTFAPTGRGLASASLSVTDAGGGSPQTVTLVGTGQ